MLGRRAAAAADDVHKAGLGEFAKQFGHVFRAFVVITELVGQARVRISANEGVGEPAKLVDMRAHLARAQRAVESDGNRIRVLDRIPECTWRLARQQTSRAVGDRARDHHGHIKITLLAKLRDREDGGLGVERVEDSLDQQQVGTAVDQSPCLLAVSGTQLIEGNGAETGIGHVRRDRCRAVGRPQRSGHEAAAAVFLLRAHGGLARKRCACLVELVGDALHAVIGLRNRSRGEGVGRHEVGASPEVREMDVTHCIRLAEIEQVVVAAHLAVPGVETRAAIAFLVELEPLDHRAHGAVEHEDALTQQIQKCSSGAGVGRTHNNDSGSVDGLHRGPQAQQVADREHEIGAIHRVEMECGDAAVDEIENLLGRNRRGD